MSGREDAYDRFKDNTPKSERMALNFRLGNLFEYKRLKDEKEIKSELFSLEESAGYNLAADSLGWSDLSSRISARPKIGGEDSRGLLGMLSGLRLSLTGRHSFYAQEEREDGRLITVDRPAPNFLRLLNFDVTTAFNLRGGRGIETVKDSVDKYEDEIFETDSRESNFLESETDSSETDRADFKALRIPWDASFSFHYRENRSNPESISKNITSTIRLELDITRNWDLSYNTVIDLDRKRVTTAGINLRRDLHCWQGTLNWTPMGAGKGYYLQISAKSPQLMLSCFANCRCSGRRELLPAAEAPLTFITTGCSWRGSSR